MQFQTPPRQASPHRHTGGSFRKMDHHDISVPITLREASATRLPTGENVTVAAPVETYYTSTRPARARSRHRERTTYGRHGGHRKRYGPFAPPATGRIP